VHDCRHVHVVFTTDTSDGLSMRNLSNHINAILRPGSFSGSGSQLWSDGGELFVEEFFFGIVPLNLEELDAVVDNELMRHLRTLSVTQRKVYLTQRPQAVA